MVAHIVLGAGSSLQILRFLEYTVGCRECPQDAGIHHGALFGFRMNLVVAIYSSVEATILIISYFFYPIVEDVVFQHILHGFLHIFHIRSIVIIS